MKRRQMATRSRSKSGGSLKLPSRMAKTGGASSPRQPFTLKHLLFNLLLWGLGIANVVLIGSFIQKHIATGNEHTISSDSEIVTTPADLKIEVLNGCGASGIARKIADHLKAQGFDPVNVENFERQDIPRTMIIDRYSNAFINGRKAARALGLSDDYVSYVANPDRLVAVSVIIGQDYQSIPIPLK